MNKVDLKEKLELMDFVLGETKDQEIIDRRMAFALENQGKILEEFHQLLNENKEKFWANLLYAIEF